VPRLDWLNAGDDCRGSPDQAFKLLDELEAGEEISNTRNGHVVARLSGQGTPIELKDRFADLVTINATDEELFSSGLEWDLPGPSPELRDS
jgi:antitoxin (DNA-binding transcriptional repressor) of toxin-antitoxin stability system